MKIRHRLTLAFFLISVLPLAVVTAYSYHSSVSALRKAAESQADQMAAEMGERMTWVLADLGDRVQRVWQMRARQGGRAASQAGITAPAVATAAARPEPGVTVNPDPAAASAEVQAEVRQALAEAVPIIERLEFMPMRTSPPPPPGAPRRPGPRGPERRENREGVAPPESIHSALTGTSGRLAPRHAGA